MPRRNHKRSATQAVKTGRVRSDGFWHSLAEGLDFSDEVLLTRICGR